MRPIVAAIAALIVFGLVAPALADGPVGSAEGKLWGLTYVTGGPEGDDQGPPIEVIYQLYESSRANLVFVGIDWGDCEPRDPGEGPSEYDFSGFDGQVFLLSSKTKICWMGLGNSWADKIKASDPDRYWKLAERFVTAAAAHANKAGIRYFQVPGNEFNLLGRPDWAQLYVEPLKHIYTAIKAASKDNIVIAGNLSYGGDEVVQALYDAGAKDHFDVLDIHAYSNDPRTGVDIFQVVEAHRAMVRNGDGGKQIFLGEGWGPMRELPGITRKSHTEPPSRAEIEALRSFLENGYRNMLTERDIYDPAWLLGARFFTLNDNYGQGKWKDRAQMVDETGDGRTDYILLDGYRFPPDTDVEPKFFNGGLVDFEGIQKNGLLDSFTPEIPKHRFEAALASDSPIFNYVTEQTYSLELKITNLTTEQMKLGAFGLRWRPSKGITISAQSDSKYPESISPGDSATCVYSVTFPKEAANRQITLIGELEYSIGERKHFTDCWLTVLVTPRFEITLLPARAILDPSEDPKRVGMSIINHTDTRFEGTVSLTATPGVRVNPTQIDTAIDARGLEAHVFGVTRDPEAVPGHYAVFVDVAGQAKDWVAVEVPLAARRASSPVKIDGTLDEWAGAAAIAIAETTKGEDGAVSHNIIGVGRFAYDDSSFYAAFEIDDDKHVQDREIWELWREDSIQIAFDPLIDGARVSGGGYKPDDYEYCFAGASRGPVVVRYQAPRDKPTGEITSVQFAFSREGNKSRYEIAFPWSEISPFDPGKGKMFAMSVLVNRSDGEGRSYVEWGGGIGEGKDPRKFIPVLLAGQP